MTRLHMYASADLAAATLGAANESTAPAYLLPDHLPLLSLLDHAFATEAGRAHPFRLGPLGESVLLDTVAHEAHGPLRAIADTPGLRRALQRAFLAAGCANLTPAALQRAAARLAPGDSRPQEIARLYGLYKDLLGTRLADDAVCFRRGLHALTRPQQPLLHDADVIDFHGLALLPPAAPCPTLHAALTALAALASPGPGGARRAVRVHLPAVDGRPTLEAALQPLQEALYRFHEADLEEVRTPLHAADTPWGRFQANLFHQQPAPLAAAPPLTVSAPATPAQEAQQVARAVRDLIDHGLPPARIAIVAQDPARRARLRTALHRYGVPARQACAEPSPTHATAAQCPPVQVLLGLYDLIGRGVPREALLHKLGSRYVSWGRPPERLPPWRVARALREAGVRDLRPGGTSDADAERRIREWLRQQSAAHAEVHPEAELAPHPSERPLLKMVEAALSSLSLMPVRGTLAEHARGALRLCGRLQLFERAEGLWDKALTADPDLLEAVDDTAALARDQEAVDLLRETLEGLPGWAQRLGRKDEILSRERFAALLGDGLSRRPLGGQGGQGVAVCDLLYAASGRGWGRLFVTGMLDSDFPGHAPEDALLPDDDRRGLNRLLGKDVFPLPQAAAARAPLWLVLALAASDGAALSYPRLDDDGRPLLRSTFVDEVLRAAGLPEPAPGPPRPVGCPPPELCRTPQELWTRALLERDRATPLLEALAQRDPQRAGRVQAVLAMEAARQAWFASRALAAAAGQLGAKGTVRALLQPGPFVGRLLDEILREALEDRLPGREAHPLSASALEDYAKCPFRFFVRRVLKAQPVQEGGDDLDALAGGRLHHAVLEVFFKERLDSSALPLRGDAGDLRAMDEAIDVVLRGWPGRERTGHRELFAARIARLRQDMARLVQREASQPIDKDLSPRLFEHRFGPLPITSPTERDGAPLHIHGIIDRVDVGPDGRALVLDYKTGRLERYEQILRHDLLDTSFQLPLYAAALRKDQRLKDQGLEIHHVSARYYSLRHGRVSQGVLTDQDMISLEPAVQERVKERNVAEVAYRLWRRLRDGDFRVDPRSCEGCGLEAACRVQLLGGGPNEY